MVKVRIKLPLYIGVFRRRSTIVVTVALSRVPNVGEHISFLSNNNSGRNCSFYVEVKKVSHFGVLDLEKRTLAAEIEVKEVTYK